MKKALAILLALALVGGAVFAQSVVNFYTEGEIQTFDLDGSSNFDYRYAFFKFSGATEEGDAGYSVTFAPYPFDNTTDVVTGEEDGEFTTTSFSNTFKTIQDWNAYYKVFDGSAKISVGKLRNASYRMGDVWGAYTFTDRITGYGMLTDILAVDSMSIGLNIPFGSFDTTLDVFKNVDLGLSYTITDIGKLIFMGNFDFNTDATQAINFGFSLSAVENLALNVLYHGDFASTSSNWFDVSGKYSLLDGALSAGAKFHGEIAEVFGWAVLVRADYDIIENLSAKLTFDIDDATEYDVQASLTYALPQGIETSITSGYNGEFYLNNTIFYSIYF